MGLISIRRLMSGGANSNQQPDLCAHCARAVLQLVVEKAPGLDTDARQGLLDQLGPQPAGTAAIDELLRADSWASELLKKINGHWSNLETENERHRLALTDVITLLAETASQADRGHSEFYDSILTSVRSIEQVGQLEDIHALRSSLNDHLSALRRAVETQRKESEMYRQSIDTNLAEVREQVHVFSRLIHSEPLSLLPTADHGRQLIGELIELRRPFVTAAIELEGIETVEHRFDKAVADRVWDRFRARTQSALPVTVHLCRWRRRLLVAVSDQMEEPALREHLEELKREVRDNPLKDEEMTRALALSPRVHVETHASGMSLDRLVERIEQPVAVA